MLHKLDPNRSAVGSRLIQTLVSAYVSSGRQFSAICYNYHLKYKQILCKQILFASRTPASKNTLLFMILAVLYLLAVVQKFFFNTTESKLVWFPVLCFTILLSTDL